MDRIAERHGWDAKFDKVYLQCSRWGEDKTSRDYAAGGLKSGCTFRITLSAWKKEKYHTKSG
eukprot:11769986-Alexandrium_andersonii.AAC.1